MEFKRNRKIKVKDSTDEKQYPKISMYNKDPPKEEITLDEFERFAVDRLKCKAIAK